MTADPCDYPATNCTPPSTPATMAPPITTTTTVGHAAPLPFTGGDEAAVGGLALSFVIIGVALVARTRARESERMRS